MVRHFGIHQSVRVLVGVYRHHEPELSLYPEANNALNALSSRSLYLVTDGHKVVQAGKIAALGIAGRFSHCYLTHQHGIKRRKPAPWVFERLCLRERAQPSSVIYVADDPTKDFVGIRPLGFRTVRVRTGRFAAAEAKKGFEAEFEIPDLASFPSLVKSLEGKLPQKRSTRS